MNWIEVSQKEKKNIKMDSSDSDIDFIEYLTTLEENEFIQRFRMSKNSFNILLEKRQRFWNRDDNRRTHQSIADLCCRR